MSEMLHDRVSRAANKNGRMEPINTSAIYTAALAEDPDLLDQLLLVHHRVCQEQGDMETSDPPAREDDSQRRRMLSAVRATVRQSSVRYQS
jgi:hypothetical protein